MDIGHFFTIVLLNPLITILVGIYQLFLFLHIPSPLGFAIILLTVLIRLVLYPLMASQIKIQKKTQDLAPHLSRIKHIHKGDTKKQHEETMKLYKEHGLNPAAGCLPSLIQLPVIIGLYSVLQIVVPLKNASIVSEVNKRVYIDALKLKSAWDPFFFGIPLGKSPSELISHLGVAILLIPLFTALFQLIQSKMLFSQNKKKDGQEKKRDDDFSSMFQTQSLYMFPLMIGFFSYTLPLGMSLYWNTFAIFGILQQYRIAGIGGLAGWIDRVKKG